MRVDYDFSHTQEILVLRLDGFIVGGTGDIWPAPHDFGPNGVLWVRAPEGVDRLSCVGRSAG